MRDVHTHPITPWGLACKQPLAEYWLAVRDTGWEPERADIRDLGDSLVKRLAYRSLGGRPKEPLHW